MNYKLPITGMISGSERIIVMPSIACTLIPELPLDFVARVHSHEGTVHA